MPLKSKKHGVMFTAGGILVLSCLVFVLGFFSGQYHAVMRGQISDASLERISIDHNYLSHLAPGVDRDQKIFQLVVRRSLLETGNLIGLGSMLVEDQELSHLLYDLEQMKDMQHKLVQRFIYSKSLDL